jgi:(1->4)-alpha-D-glucan 1-alpha-D-glucosylmutase
MSPQPTSSYRLQMSREFTLGQAADTVDYLDALHAGAVYTSPLLAAVPGSAHGYDVVDHRVVDAERGGEAGLAALSARCREHGLALVLDLVPNHMGVAVPPVNEAWWDLLKNGRASAYASWFDVDWSACDGKILLPVLGDDTAEADPNSYLQVAGDELRYFEHRYPLRPGSALPGDSPADVHDRQHYQLISFRRADTEQNYRRFFAITDLAGVRVEHEQVFERTHETALGWLSRYAIAGLRIDHPDGLADPVGYLDRLASAAPGSWITVEKILEPGEELPAEWPVAGTTGYDALAEVTYLMIDPAAEGSLDQIYRDLTWDATSWDEHAEAGKRFVATTMLQAEARRIARLAPDVPEAVAAITELAVAFPVYRSYLPAGQRWLTEASERARRTRPELSVPLDALSGRLADPGNELAVRFQQLTGAVTAKGVEDTAFYRYTRFLALNEVGCSPGVFGSGIQTFHGRQRRRQDRRPAGMTTLSTHDTKRGEDVRAMLAVLAEMPQAWEETAGRLLRSAPIPSRTLGYLLWQTFAAVGMIDADRMHRFAEKAMREAAQDTTWTDPDPAYEQAVHAAVDTAYRDSKVRSLIEDTHRSMLPAGWSNSLSQKLVQLTMPGVPDVYQGTEIWDDSLVDPDNRRPVDFGDRRRLLTSLGDGQPPMINSTGSAKLWLVHTALKVRRNMPELFCDYEPLFATGPAADHLVAFDRGGAITAVTRLPLALGQADGWGSTSLRLPPGRHIDRLSGHMFAGNVLAVDLFESYPVAFLTADTTRSEQ